MTKTTSRRAILAGAAALATAPALAASPNTDPIFALIEAHKIAFMERLQTLHDYYADETCEEAEARSSAAMGANYNAAIQLVEITPTTLAGVVALIDYVDDFAAGKFKLHGMESSMSEWPGGNLVDEEIYDVAGAEPGELGFAFAVLLNVRNALSAMAAQS
jgi:hypothetical protein